jgi:hypothetical protein
MRHERAAQVAACTDAAAVAADVVAKGRQLLTGAAVVFGVLGAAALVRPAQAQQANPVVARLQVEPAQIRLTVGETVPIRVQALDDEGVPIDAAFRLAAPRQALWLGESEVRGLVPGEYTLNVMLFPSPDIDWVGETPPSVPVSVTVLRPGLERIDIESSVERLFVGTQARHHARAVLPDGSIDPAVRVTWHSSDPRVATVDRFGTVTGVAVGVTTITAEAEGTTATVTYDVRPFPAVQLEITGGADQARTGDVLAFDVRALDAAGRELADVPVTWSHTFVHRDAGAAQLVAGGIVQDGRFVAEVAGEHTIIATAGPLAARRVVEIVPRDVVRRIEVLGQGTLSHTRTTDFWVFEGMDGRDYAITGSKDVGGQAYMWDVTDPANIILTDSILVDARSVNDVKVSPDGRYASMTREGASDRRNGVVLLDLSTPAHPRIAAEHTDGLTGGVHNSFATNDYLFALSAGEKYVIIDVRDIYNPRNVGEFKYPNAQIHDVWIRDGIAYSAQRPYGGIIVDVGNGGWGGSPQNPVLIAKTGPMPEGGGFHAVFPYVSESTGRSYLFLGDEIMNRAGRALAGTSPRGAYRQRYDPETGEGGVPLHTSGYLHIVDITDPTDPRKVAKYHVPEYGTHNLWIEDDILYQAYYEGGLRIVDVSGELMGDLHRQGREIAVFKPYDPVGYVANAPMVWSTMLHKGNIFLTDTNSGIWSVRLQPPTGRVIP